MFENSPENVKLFGEIMRAHNHIMQHRLNRCGVYRGQHFVLFYLFDNPGKTQIEMAQKFGISKATLGATVSRMEKNGLIYRKTDENDARCNRLYITPKGRKIAADCLKQVTIVQQAMFNCFSDEESKVVEDVLFRMLEGLKELEKESNG